jgi:AraC-like DNA-binding protein
MKPVQFEFTSVRDEDLIANLGTMFNSSTSSNILSIPKNAGNGSVVRKQLDEGLVAVCWDLQLNDHLKFQKHPAILKEEGRGLTINYLLYADNLVLTSTSLNKKFVLNGRMNIICIPDDVGISFEVKKGMKARWVSLWVSPLWLSKELGSIQHSMAIFLQSLLLTVEPFAYIESSTPEESRVVRDVFDHLSNVQHGILNFKPRMMILIADFFERIHRRPAKETSDMRFIQYQKMQAVEKILRDHMQTPLPDMETIARMSTTSLSTLKRHFKGVYGKGIYEYYLEIKMEFAKRLLIDNDLSVNEVAFMLNYEKVSSFIDTFKKHQGFSPGSLRRNAS